MCSFNINPLQRYSSWLVRYYYLNLSSVYSAEYRHGGIFLLTVMILFIDYPSGLNQGVTGLPLKGWPLASVS